MQSWLFLMGAILCEVAGTTSMKLSEGFSRLIPSVLIFVFYGLAFIHLTFALKTIDISIVYAIWSGAGTMLITLIGAFFFKEPLTPLKIASIGCIVLGVVGLHLAGARH